MVNNELFKIWTKDKSPMFCEMDNWLLFVSLHLVLLTCVVLSIIFHSSLLCESSILTSCRRRAAQKERAHQQGGGVKVCGTCDLAVSANQNQPHHLGRWQPPSTAISTSRPSASLSSTSSSPHRCHPNGPGCHSDALGPTPSAYNANCCSGDAAQQLPASQERFLPSKAAAGLSSPVVRPTDEGRDQSAAGWWKAWPITASGSDSVPNLH